ncbi:hypothetical protein FC12_GL000765 [Lacticaseibacillus paracasei subsp. tolerans DSM 20258]|nr:hypothetical protein FC12_GL000765 [Lacticaseibacillus paracasei subsp. tolerans DSM 20258]MCT3364809.1 hypothetical protein [Lacticaseibacillus paracasei]GEL39101.1 hypothetical protein LPA06_19520 [Lacticaseibacillus paracasei subsp. tolerans]
MTKTNEFTPAQIKAIRKIIRDEIARHDRQIEREEELNQQELDAADIEAVMEWGDLE